MTARNGFPAHWKNDLPLPRTESEAFAWAQEFTPLSGPYTHSGGWARAWWLLVAALCAGLFGGFYLIAAGG